MSQEMLCQPGTEWGKGPDSLVHFCLPPPLLLLHFLSPLLLSLLLLPEAFQPLPLLLLKGDEFRLCRLPGPVPTLRLPCTGSSGSAAQSRRHSVTHTPGWDVNSWEETMQVWEQCLFS